MPQKKGFTLVEMLVVVAIMGILSLGSVPASLNSLETRSLENSARDILTTMQQAKLLSVSTKLNHRVIFSNTTGSWAYWIEEETSSGTWTRHAKYPYMEIPSKLTPTINLPADLTVEYSSIGFVTNYDGLHNSITIESPKLKKYSQPDLRILMIYAGGSIQYIKSQT
jgi:prepilin-type N-terminal cleavage/methylation domain-containing protein